MLQPASLLRVIADLIASLQQASRLLQGREVRQVEQLACGLEDRPPTAGDAAKAVASHPCVRARGRASGPGSPESAQG